MVSIVFCAAVLIGALAHIPASAAQTDVPAPAAVSEEQPASAFTRGVRGGDPDLRTAQRIKTRRSFSFLAWTLEGRPVRMNAVSLGSNRTRAASGKWLGNLHFAADALEFNLNHAESPQHLDKITLTTQVEDDGAKVQALANLHIKSFVFDDQRISNVRIRVRLRHVDPQLLEEVLLALETSLNGDAAADAAPLGEVLNRFADDALAAGLVLHLEDFSATFRGKPLQVKGRLSLDPMGPGERSLWLKGVNLRYDMTIPVAIITPITSWALNGAAATDIKAAVDSFVAQGYARKINNALVTRFEMKQGVITLNGKIMK